MWGRPRASLCTERVTNSFSKAKVSNWAGSGWGGGITLKINNTPDGCVNRGIIGMLELSAIIGLRAVHW